MSRLSPALADQPSMLRKQRQHGADPRALPPRALYDPCLPAPEVGIQWVRRPIRRCTHCLLIHMHNMCHTCASRTYLHTFSNPILPVSSAIFVARHTSWIKKDEVVYGPRFRISSLALFVVWSRPGRPSRPSFLAASQTNSNASRWTALSVLQSPQNDSMTNNSGSRGTQFSGLVFVLAIQNVT